MSRFRFPRRNWLLAIGVLCTLASVAAGYATLAQARRYAETPTSVAVRALPIASFDNRDPGRTRFGALEFRGGLQLSANFEPFGGMSGLLMQPDGSRLIAVTDRGSWLAARLVYRDGRPDALAEVEIAPILGADGKPLAAGRAYDTESLTATGGRFYVGIERVHRIVRFDFAKDGVAARAAPLAVPSDFKTFGSNKGLECLAAPQKGAPHAGKLIAVTEQSLDSDGHHRAFVLDPAAHGGKAEALRFSIRRSDDFDISDCAILPPGDLLILERRYSIARGVAMRIRRLPLAAIKEGALIDGTPLIEADLGYQIDNMEGMALHRNAAGETVITLVSDDNFSSFQRNILLQFVLVDP